MTCFKCKRVGHIQTECPKNDDKEKERKRFKIKQAMIAEYAPSEDDDSESSSDEEEEEIANLCLMAHDESDEEVTSLSKDDELDPYVELQEDFSELYNRHVKLLKEHKALKKSIKDLVEKSKLEKLKHEYNLLESINKRLEKNNTMLSKKVDNLSLSYFLVEQKS